MPTEFWALITLAIFLAIAVAAIVREIKHGAPTWQSWVLYVVARVYCSMVYHWRANRRCPFPANGPALIVANHRSPIDPLCIWNNHHLGQEKSKPRIISCLMASEYYKLPVLGWCFRALEAIPVERDGRDMLPLKTALRKLKDGQLVGIFPEGKINIDQYDRLLPGNPGVAWLALRAKVPVYPVFIRNSPGGDHMIQPFFTPARVEIVYGEPIDLSEFFELPKNHELLQEVTDLIMSRLADLGGVQYFPKDEDEKTIAGRVG